MCGWVEGEVVEKNWGRWKRRIGGRGKRRNGGRGKRRVEGGERGELGEEVRESHAFGFYTHVTLSTNITHTYDSYTHLCTSLLAPDFNSRQSVPSLCTVQWLYTK